MQSVPIGLDLPTANCRHPADPARAALAGRSRGPASPVRAETVQPIAMETINLNTAGAGTGVALVLALALAPAFVRALALAAAMPMVQRLP
jgi:hypothetical protein